MARMVYFFVKIAPFYLFLPSRPLAVLVTVTAPLDEDHGDRPGPVPDLAAGGGKDDPLLCDDSL